MRDESTGNSSLSPLWSKRFSLAVSPPRPYVYKSRLKRAAAHVLDAVGDLLLAPPPAAVDWSKIRKAAVLRLDHMGDVLHALPALELLRRALPKAEIHVFTGPWGREVAQMSRLAHAVEVFQAPWFLRPRRVEWPWGAIGELGQRLKAGGYDAALELRGDLRHHLALWLSGIPVRAGHAVTAGKFLLTHPAAWREGLHEAEQNVEVLRQAGILKGQPGEIPFARVVPGRQAEIEADRVWRKLKLKGRVVAIQAACGTRAKRWMPERWAQVLDGLPKGFAPVLLGSKDESQEMESLAKACAKRPAVAAGLLSLKGLAAFLKRCAGLVSVDSGPAHLAAAVGTPVLALYSGTNRAAQWGLRGRKVHMIQKQIECSPCELADCPFGNECMRRIQAGEAIRAARTMLKARA